MENKAKKTNAAPPESKEQWFLTVMNDLEFEQRTQKPPSQELIEHLNHMTTKPPFCWTKKYNERSSRL